MLRPLPEDLRSNWYRAYQHWFINPPSGAYIGDLERLQSKAGITDELIVAVIEKALTTKRLNVMAWARTVLEQLVPFGVTTPEEWQAFETERQAEEDRNRQAAAEARQQRSKPAPKKSNVLLHRETKDAGYYDYLYRKFEDEPAGGEPE